MAWHTGLTPVSDTFEHAFSSQMDNANFDAMDFDFDLALSSISSTVLEQHQEPVNCLQLIEDIQAYGQIVGPSQGLSGPDEAYAPAMPLNKLIAATNAPGVSFSLQGQASGGVGMSFTGSANSDVKSDLSAEQHFQAIGHSVRPHTCAVGMPDGMIATSEYTEYVSDLASTTENHSTTNHFANIDTARTNEPALLLNSETGHDGLFRADLLHTAIDESGSISPLFTNSGQEHEKRLSRTNPNKYFDERPKKPVDKPWIRINAATQGKTSRTGKINHYNPDVLYDLVRHPLNSVWTSAQGTEFRYNRWHELVKDHMPAEHIEDFIRGHPRTEGCRLTLYIQCAPADSKRRYPTSSLDRCRFSECPMREHGNNGSFLHGHYRVALDELSHTYGCNHRECNGRGGSVRSKSKQCNDPFHVAGYVHLYCLERFLDLPALCALPHIRVEADGRMMLPKEPNGNFAPALRGTEFGVATHFVEAARTGQLREHAGWAMYPKHVEGRDSEGNRRVAHKHHKHTLNYALQMCKNATRSGRVMSRLKPSNVAVHRGDLKMYCLGRKGLLSEAQIAHIMTELDINDDASEYISHESALCGKRRASNTDSSGSSSSGHLVRWHKKAKYAPY